MSRSEGDIFSLGNLYIAYRKAKAEAFYEHTHFHALAFTNYERALDTNLRRLRSRLVARQADWHTDWAAAGLVDNEASGMLDIVEHMDPDSISALCSVVSRIDKSGIADELLQRWIKTHQFTPEQAVNVLGARNNEHLHPSIIKQLRLTAGQAPSLSRNLAAVAQRIQRNFYFDEDEQVVANSTIEQYEEALKSLGKEEFVEFIRMHLDWIRYGNNRPWKAAGIENFVEACARIVEREARTRLADILRRAVFKDAANDLRVRSRMIPDRF